MNAVRGHIEYPRIAMVDTCCDPTPIDYVIPSNDDAAKSIALIVGIIKDAIQEGLEERKLEKDKEVPFEQKDESVEIVPAKRTRARRQRPEEAKSEEKAVPVVDKKEEAIDEQTESVEEKPAPAEEIKNE